VGVVIRVLVGLAVLLVLWLKWSVTFEKSTTVLLWVFGSAYSARLVELADACHWEYVAPTAGVILFLVFRRNYTGMAPWLALKLAPV
jgi:phosphatidylinositol glycan class H protein